MNVRIVFGSLGLLCAIVLVAHTACAAVFERDWKTPGDGLLTYDDVNRREWLDVPVTMGLSIPRYENVVAELGPGGAFDGFVVASSSDAIALARSAGIDTSTLDFFTNESATSRLIQLLQPTFGTNYSIGYLDELSTNPFFPGRLAAVFERRENSMRAGLSLSTTGSNDIVRPITTGVLIYRHAIPEPATFTLCLGSVSVLAGMSIRMRRRFEMNYTSFGTLSTNFN